MIEFIIATHNLEVLQNNILKSNIVKGNVNCIMMGHNNLPAAYNTATKLNQSGYVCYVHHDVFLPDSFKDDLLKSIDKLPADWGVIGVAGCILENGKKVNKGYINDRGHVWGKPDGLPAEVQTLDEMLLITRGDFKFDDQFPFDFYGADICMQAQAQGKKCYAINAYCFHNSTRIVGGRTKEFYIAEDKFREKWKAQLPIVTTCSLLNP